MDRIFDERQKGLKSLDITFSRSMGLQIGNPLHAQGNSQSPSPVTLMESKSKAKLPGEISPEKVRIVGTIRFQHKLFIFIETQMVVKEILF